MLQYIVLFEGVAYGPFATNDQNVNASSTDAQYWSMHNLHGGVIMELKAPGSFMPPIPWADTTG